MKRILNSLGYRIFSLLIQLFFMLCWLSFLPKTGTDYLTAYYTTYIVCFALGIVTMLLRFRKPTTWNGRQIAILSVASVLLSASVTAANYDVFLPLAENRFKMVAIFVGGLFIAWNILAYFFEKMPFRLFVSRVHKPWKVVTVFFVTFVVISVINLLYLFFTVYPGTVTPDSLKQIGQILNGYTSNHHPFWHTVVISLFFNAGDSLFGSANAGVALYCVASALFMAACFSYGVSTLYRAGASRFVLVLCGGLYALLPYHVAYSVTMWKDVVFGGAVLLFTATLFRILKKIGHPVWNLIGLFFTAVGVGVWRSNGWLALVAFAVFLILYCILAKQKMLATVLVVCGAVTVSWVMRGPVITALNIQQPDLVESLSIPVQQVARVIAEGRELEEEEYEMLSRIMDVEEVPELYESYLSDPIKDEIRSKDHRALVDHKVEYLKLWIKLGLRYPDEYVKAWIDQTCGYYNGGYQYWSYSYGVTHANDYSVSNDVQPNAVKDFYDGYFSVFYDYEIFQPARSIGLHVWGIFGFFALCFMRKRQEMLLCIIPLTVIATLLVATPVFAEFRYAYCIFTTIPFLAAACLGNDATGEKSDA